MNERTNEFLRKRPAPEVLAAGVFAFALCALAFALDPSLRNQSLPKTAILCAALPAVLLLLPWRRPACSFAGTAVSLLLAWLLASALFIAPPGARVDALEEWSRWLAGALAALAASTLAFRLPWGAPFLFRAWVGAGAATALYGFVQVLAPGLDPLGWSDRERLFATWANPTFAAGLYASLLPWCAAETLALHARWPALSQRSRLAGAIAWPGLSLILGFALLLTFSRGGWLAAASALIAFAATLLLLSSGRSLLAGFLGALAKGRSSARPALILLVLAVWAAALATWPGVFQASRRARMNPGTTSGSTLGVRHVAWGAAAQAFREKPLAGHGLGMYQRLFPSRKGPDAWRTDIGDNTVHAHSEPAELAAETGTIGLGLVLLALLAWSAGIVRRLARPGTDPVQAVFVASLMACAFAGFLDSFWGVHFRWTSGALAFWLPAGLAWGWSRRLENPPPEPSPLQWTRRGWAIRAAALLLAWAAILPPAAWTWSASRWMRQGELRRRAGDSEGALLCLREAIRLNPWLLESHYRAGSLLSLGEEPALALEAWEKLDELGAPFYASLARNKTRVLLQLDRREEALETWLAAEVQDRSPSSALLAADLAQRWPEGEIPQPLLLEGASFDAPGLDSLPALAADLKEAGLLPPSRAWLFEAQRRDPMAAFPALALSDWLISNHRAADAATLLEEVLVLRRDHRAGFWRESLAQAGPERVKRILEEEGRLRRLRAQAMENAFYQPRPNQAAPLTPEESHQIVRIREAYADAKLWWPLP